jgi:hypothetical protein
MHLKPFPEALKSADLFSFVWGFFAKISELVCISLRWFWTYRSIDLHFAAGLVLDASKTILMSYKLANLFAFV